MYHGPCDEMTEWFGSLGYSHNPLEHGVASDWALDLVAVGFAKPAKYYGHTMRTRDDLAASSKAFMEHYMRVRPAAGGAGKWGAWQSLLRACCAVFSRQSCLYCRSDAYIDVNQAAAMIIAARRAMLNSALKLGVRFADSISHCVQRLTTVVLLLLLWLQTQDVTQNEGLPATTVGNQGTIADRVRNIMAPSTPGEQHAAAAAAAGTVIGCLYCGSGILQCAAAAAACIAR
jgi:hypothetical protein